MRGEDFRAFDWGSAAPGSPPRAWGRRGPCRASRPPSRFTPTCVGKTRASTAPARIPSVHPHVRGEDGTGNTGTKTFAGSPPRAWGRPDDLGDFADPPRFTPTCVGKTQLAGVRCAASAVHPHVRGEDERRPSECSPPRAWGRLRDLDTIPKRLRFTPTCVGKTTPDSISANSLSVHPHVRGEDVGRIGDGHLLERFTPTCVGKTRCPSQATARPPVHPHVRGEDCDIAPKSGNGFGSPPRAWGRRDSHRRPVPSRSVHPHVRGEDDQIPRRLGRCRGSPPRAWGRLATDPSPSHSTRFTPTCVGKTRCASFELAPPTVHPHVRGEDASGGP